MKIGTLAQILALSDAAIGFGAVQETPSKEITATSAVVLRPMGVGGHPKISPSRPGCMWTDL